MAAIDYSAAGVPVRDDLQKAHAALWEHLRKPGSWWTGAERIAIANESRHALVCALCVERKGALSPSAVEGIHDTQTDLPANVIDVIHRIRTDPGRLSRRWFDDALASGLDDGAYVEAVGVVTLLAGADYFARALGIDPFPLPEPLPGEPSHYRPPNTSDGIAWVPMILPENAGEAEADLYWEGSPVPNIVRALSLVPDHVRALKTLSDAHYLSISSLMDTTLRRALDRMQMELVAARVSAVNECFY